MKVSFGTKTLIACLLCLSFTKAPSSGSSHQKFSLTGRKVTSGVRPFMIVILNRKSYDPVTQRRYITQLKRLGFTQKEIETCLGY